jgi:glycosyltransferase involved in cell wall biosynthesis
VLLNVASLTPVKDQRTLIDAFAEVRRALTGAQLHLVGAGPLREDLEERSRKSLLEDAVTFHDAVPHDELPPFYRAADLNVVSSRYESQGMTVLEAAACGTPTVGTEVGLLPEFGEGVGTVAVNDPAALAAGILEILEDPRTTSAMGRVAHAAVHARFTLDRCTDGFIRLYRYCLLGIAER